MRSKFSLIGFIVAVALVVAVLVPTNALAVDETNYTATAIGYTNNVDSPAIVSAKGGNYDFRTITLTAPAGADLVWRASPTLPSNQVALCGGVIPRSTSLVLPLPTTYKGVVSVKSLTNEAAVTGVKIKDLTN